MLSRAAVVRLTLVNAVLAVLVTTAIPLPTPQATVEVPVQRCGDEWAADVLASADPETALSDLAARDDVDRDAGLVHLTGAADGVLAGQALCALAQRAPGRAQDLVVQALFDEREFVPRPLVLRAAALAPCPAYRTALETAIADGDGLEQRLALAALAGLGDVAAGRRLFALADGEDPWEDLGVADALALVDPHTAATVRTRALACLPPTSR